MSTDKTPAAPFAAEQNRQTAHLPECPTCFTPAGYACVEGRSDSLHEVATHAGRDLFASFSAAIEADQDFDRACRERILSGAGRLV